MSKFRRRGVLWFDETQLPKKKKISDMERGAGHGGAFGIQPRSGDASFCYRV